MLATAVRIQARFKTDIRAAVAGDNRLASIAKILRGAARPLFSLGIIVDTIGICYVDVQLFETICRAPGCTTPADRIATLRCFFNDRSKCLLRWHPTSSHEHIALSSGFFDYSATPMLHAIACGGKFQLGMECHAVMLVYSLPVTDHLATPEGWQRG